jgi:2',3'-cyclic-nucleotide 2'-phosphodiesterase (5'-nucleotidase family)
MLLVLACGDPNSNPQILHGPDEAIGFISVPLDANAQTVRTGEAVIGNLITDAMKQEIISQGYHVDFAVTNGGAIRFDQTQHPSGIYPPGEISIADLENILPFDNKMVLIALKGEDVLTMLERSVAELPREDSPTGNFLQVSKGLSFFVDLFAEPQIIDQNQTPPVIVTAGKRVGQVFINGESLNLSKTYMVATNAFLASGGDGYVAFTENVQQQTQIDILDRNALLHFIQINSPVSPVIEGRINF